MIPEGSRRYPFGAWVRGFYLPEMKWVGIRPFFWPRRQTDCWNASHAWLNDRISRQVARLVRECVPRARIEMDIDNRRLQELTGLRGW
jgi:hypothetical protein